MRYFVHFSSRHPTLIRGWLNLSEANDRMLLHTWSAVCILSYLSGVAATPIEIDNEGVSLIALDEVEALWNNHTLWIRQDTGEVLEFEPGTEFNNNPTPPPGNTGLGLTGTDSEPEPVTSIRTSFSSQPNVRSECGQYKMVQQYSSKYRNIPLCSGDGDACVEMEHVVQGETGDCGFGSAIIALIANGQSGLVHDALEWKGNRKLVATFKTRSSVQKGRFIWKTLVNIDDKLPVFIDKSWKTISTPQQGCAKNRGYQFCALRGEGCSRRLQVPFLEKAWAKFVDFHGDGYRSEHAKGKFGYEGLDGTDSARVLEAFTGNKAQHIYRNPKQYPSAKMKETILSCLSTKVACTLGTLKPAEEREC